ncbi:MPND protein, partial [Donacobius atricapilla]|nr:MPND protein [Donacobius atricapilla]
KAAGGARGAVLTRRGITLRVLLRDGFLEPGRGVLSIYYLGKKFVGDLGSDGTITWQETGQVFNSPSAWATHCKRLVNPAKKSGCGWASVRYKGQKLDQYKAAWLRKHQPNVPPPEEVGAGWPPPETPRLRGELGASPVCPQSLASEGEEDELPEEEEEEAAREGRVPVPEPAAPKKPEERSKKQQGKSLAEPAGAGELPWGVPGVPGGPAAVTGPLSSADAGTAGKRPEMKPRVPVRYCTLGTRDSASRALCPPDLPEPVPAGAVAGGVVPQPPLRARAAVPARHRRADGLSAQAAGQRQRLPALPGAHLRYVPGPGLPGGWGGCRPPVPAPSVPTGPFYHGNAGVESKIAPFWVMPPPEQRPNDYGIPMDVEVTYIQDGFLTNDVVQEMTLLVEFYKGAPDLVKFQELWSQDQTYLDKLKVGGEGPLVGHQSPGLELTGGPPLQGSLASRTPKDQSFTHILEQIFSLLKLSG